MRTLQIRKPGNGGPDESDQNARVYVGQQEEAGQWNA